eukprot:g19622.t1
MVIPAPTGLDTPVPFVTAADIRSVFLGVNSRNATGLESVPSRALRSCADLLVEVFTDNFNLSLLQAKVPTCFKKTTIITVPKKPHAKRLNDYCPVALTSIIMNSFERLVRTQNNSSLPPASIPYNLPTDVT